MTVVDLNDVKDKKALERALEGVQELLKEYPARLSDMHHHLKLAAMVLSNLPTDLDSPPDIILRTKFKLEDIADQYNSHAKDVRDFLHIINREKK